MRERDQRRVAQKQYDFLHPRHGIPEGGRERAVCVRDQRRVAQKQYDFLHPRHGIPEGGREKLDCIFLGL